MLNSISYEILRHLLTNHGYWWGRAALPPTTRKSLSSVFGSSMISVISLSKLLYDACRHGSWYVSQAPTEGAEVVTRNIVTFIK